jgi:hypothetical protein
VTHETLLTWPVFRFREPVRQVFSKLERNLTEDVAYTKIEQMALARPNSAFSTRVVFEIPSGDPHADLV